MASCGTTARSCWKGTFYTDIHEFLFVTYMLTDGAKIRAIYTSQWGWCSTSELNVNLIVWSIKSLKNPFQYAYSIMDGQSNPIKLSRFNGRCTFHFSRIFIIMRRRLLLFHLVELYFLMLCSDWVIWYCWTEYILNNSHLFQWTNTGDLRHVFKKTIRVCERVSLISVTLYYRVVCLYTTLSELQTRDRSVNYTISSFSYRDG